MANEARPGEPLAAPIGEQLRTKDQLDAEAEAARRADAQAQRRTERRKEEERAEVARHLGDAAEPAGWAHLRAAAAERGREQALLRDWGGRGLPLTGIALALLGVATGRRWLVWAGLPLVAGVLLLRNRLPAR
jgi:hypothetical protein